MSAPTIAMPHMLVLRMPAMLQYRFSQFAALSPVQWAVHLPAPGNVDLRGGRHPSRTEQKPVEVCQRQMMMSQFGRSWRHS